MKKIIIGKHLITNEFAKEINAYHYIRDEKILKLAHSLGYKGDHSQSQSICNTGDASLIESDMKELYIAATPAHFDAKKAVYNRQVLKISDPIVFRYCKGGLQVISKWGLEGNDPALVNEIQN